jgi:valyl-tRNA synthetase
VTLAREGATFCLPLADVIDVEAERARLAKTIDKLSKEAKGLRSKLSNEPSSQGPRGGRGRGPRPP